MTGRAAPSLDVLSIRDYAELLASDAPSPGGGSAAAFAAAFGACLVEMVCGINFKRPKNPDPAASGQNLKRAAPVRKRLLELATRDAESYAKIAEHWKTKSPELEKALEDACGVPLEIAARALDLLKVARTEIARTSPQLAGDLVEAVLLLTASVRSSRLHVEANARAMKNAARAAEFRRRIDEVLEDASAAGAAFETLEKRG